MKKKQLKAGKILFKHWKIYKPKQKLLYASVVSNISCKHILCVLFYPHVLKAEHNTPFWICFVDKQFWNNVLTNVALVIVGRVESAMHPNRLTWKLLANMDLWIQFWKMTSYLLGSFRYAHAALFWVSMRSCRLQT